MQGLHPAWLALIGTGFTFLCTAMGAAMVFLFRKGVKANLQRIFLGFAAGVMIAASVWSLLIPSIEMAEEQGQIGWIPAAGGFVLGGLFLMLLDRLLPHLHPGSDLFHIVTLPCRGNLEAFCRAARERSRSQQTFLDQEKEAEDLLYLSCLPWVDLTSCTNERSLDPDDAIPRIAWGKIVERGGREALGMSVEVNHRFVDGVHIGRFYEALQARIDALEP